ncbi:hypothetical protein [Shumkonia mesophila]|nr:hypothetical protein [Shumkonia mesophila]
MRFDDDTAELHALAGFPADDRLAAVLADDTGPPHGIDEDEADGE